MAKKATTVVTTVDSNCVTYYETHMNFPSKKSFNSIAELRTMSLDIKESSINNHDPIDIIKIAAYIKHLGNNNIDYILSNVSSYIRLFDFCANFYPNVNELMATRALNMLIAVNIYLKHYGYKFNLPSIMSRNQLDHEQLLIEYFNSIKARVTIGNF